MATTLLLFLTALGANEAQGSMASESLYSWPSLGTLLSFIAHVTDPCKPVQSLYLPSRPVRNFYSVVCFLYNDGLLKGLILLLVVDRLNIIEQICMRQW